MQLPLMGPMFDNRQDLLGIPAGLVVLGLGSVGLLVGVLLLRRVTPGEGDARSFRATGRQGSRAALVVSAVGVACLVGLGALVVVAVTTMLTR